MEDYETVLDCPKCNSGKLVRKTNLKTKEHFLGCSNYPKCDYTQEDEHVETFDKGTIDLDSWD